MAEFIEIGGPQECPANAYGRKAARLHELARAGFRVQGGLAISADEHLAHLAKKGLSLQSSRQEVLSSTVDAEFAELLQNCLSGAVRVGFAVRSSSLTEDFAGRSMAGRYVSVLDVPTRGISKAALEVWASAHPSSDDEPPASPMALIVQFMCLGHRFGVSASINPIDGRDVVVVELGLSPESVTSGSESDEVFEVDRSLKVRTMFGARSCRRARDVKEIATLTRNVGKYFKEPTEIEVACTPFGIVVLQARPLVVLGKGAEPSGIPPGSWTLDRVHYPYPMTVLLESTFPPIVARASAKAFAEYGVFAKCLEVKTLLGWPYVQLVPLSKGSIPWLPGSIIGLIVRLHPRYRKRIRASMRAVSSRTTEVNLRDWSERVAPKALGIVKDINSSDLSGWTRAEFLRTHDNLLGSLEEVVESNFLTDFSHLIPLAQFGELVRRRDGWSDAEVVAVVQEQSQTSALYSTSLERVANSIRDNPLALEHLRRSGSQSMDSILAADRQIREIWNDHSRRWASTLVGYDVDQPTLCELRDVELKALVGILEREDGRLKNARSDLDRSTSHRRILKAAADSFHVREEGESVKAALLGALRLLALELGRRMVDVGELERADHVVNMTIEELRRSYGMTSLPIPRSELMARAQRRHNAARRVPPAQLGREPVRDVNLRWLPKGSREVHQAASLIARNEVLSGVAGANTLKGRGVSAGSHTGRARIIHDVSDLRSIEAGDVVVAVSISSLWVAGLWQAGALVAEYGGLLSHAAIVARERGIPAVLGVKGATRVIKSGQFLTIDGELGTLVLTSPK